MKKNIFKIIFALITSLMIFSCEEDNISTINTSKKLYSTESAKQFEVSAKIGVRTRWKGFSGDCEPNRTCGGCIGLCVFIGFEDAPSSYSDIEIAEGAAYATITIITPKLIQFSCDSIFDNGDGTVTISDDFYVNDIVASKLGYSSIKILKGKYNIDYSSNPKGVAIFNMVTT